MRAESSARRYEKFPFHGNLGLLRRQSEDLEA